jgi:hypothetical protein
MVPATSKDATGYKKVDKDRFEKSVIAGFQIQRRCEALRVPEASVEFALSPVR